MTEGVGAPLARLLIADDHALIREGTRAMLASETDLEVVGEATNGREAVEMCRRLRPDLVLMDVRMPEMDGLAATRAIKADLPSTGILIVTTHENPDYLYEAIKAGAAGYVLKDATKQGLVEAVRRVLGGESPLDQEIAAQLLKRLVNETGDPAGQPFAFDEGAAEKPPLEPAKPVKIPAPLVEPLTPRELEILGLLVQGRTNPQIARELVISAGTAKNHVQHIIAKLGVSDRTQAAVHAVESGLIDRR